MVLSHGALASPSGKKRAADVAGISSVGMLESPQLAGSADTFEVSGPVWMGWFVALYSVQEPS